MRRIIIIVVILAVLAGAILVGGTLILRSDWLAQQILANASGRLGLEVEAESISLGWSGRATLGEISVRMPLREEVVFSADRLQLGLSAVPWIVLGRPIRVHSVALDEPQVFLQQYENGRWNVQEVWERVRASLGPPSPRERRIQLPRLTVRDATVRITASDGTTQTVTPVQFDGRRLGRIVWGFDLEAPPLARVEGRVIEGRDWTHEIRFAVQQIGPLVGLVLGQEPAPIQLTGQWKGSVRDDTLAGRMQLEDLAVRRTRLQGMVAIEATPDHVTLSPRGLLLTEPNLAGESLALTDGAVRISRERIAVEFITARAGGLGGRLDGYWEPQARRGQFQGSWAGVWPEAASQLRGTYQLTLKSPRTGRREAQASVTAQAQTAVGSWHFVANAQGEGADWPSSQWQIQIPAFSWVRDDRRLDITGALARVDLSWPEMQLTSLSVPDAERVQAEARFDAETRRWSAQLVVEQLRGQFPDPNGFDLRISAEGDDRQARIGELRLALNDSVVTARGDVSFAKGELHNAQLEADWLAHDPRPGPARVEQPPGRWHVQAAVAGQIQPLALEAQATLTGQSIALGQRWVDRVQVPVHARVDDGQVDAVTPPFELLGGQWQLLGRYALSGRATEVQVMATDLSLGAVVSMAGLPLTSEGEVRGEVRLRMPGFDVARAVATGSWSAVDVNLPPLAAERAEGALRIANGLVRLGQIRLEQDGGLVRADVSLRLERPEVVSVELAAEDWPMQLEERALRLVVDGQTKLQVDLLKRTGDGQARLAGRVRWQQKDLADLRLAARLQEQSVDVQELHAEFLGGSLDGTARLSLHRWIESAAQLRWQGIQPRQLEAWLPPFARFEGALSGSLVVEQASKLEDRRQGIEDEMPTTGDNVVSRPPSSETRPLGPTHFTLEADFADGRFGPAQIGPWRVVGYLDPNRLLVQDASFDVVDGHVQMRARVSRREGRSYGSIVADFNDLNLEQLVHAIDPNAGVYVGRVSGSTTILPAFNNGVSLNGEGRIRVTQSDLAGSRVVRTLYDTLNLRFGPQEPTGTGEVRVQFQGAAVALSSIQYFNRGVEIRGAAEIQNVNLGADSPIDGYAVGSTRILAGIKLPAIGSLDRLLGAFQTDAASVKIGGTLGDTQVQVVPLPEILGPFRRLLWSQLRE